MSCDFYAYSAFFGVLDGAGMNFDFGNSNSWQMMLF
jgi:hypothetical protein